MKKTIYLLILFLAAAVQINAQSVLEEYIREGLDNNLVLKQKQVSVEQGMTALKSANALFYPGITLMADYLSGEGGRNISIPVGDLMNPVYATLNQLTGSSRFPQIENVKQDFLPFQFYDVKLRVSMPLLNTDIIKNSEIAGIQNEITRLDLEAYKKELVKEISNAYYGYLMAVNGVKIYNNAIELALEGRRVNEKLLKNGELLPVYLLRADAEIEELRAKLSGAQTSESAAAKYFNFLLNRDAAAEIKIDETVFSSQNNKTDVLSDAQLRNDREELMMLEGVVKIKRSVTEMNRLNWIPKINVFADLGAQDSKWNYNQDSKYYLFGVQLSLPLFESFRQTYKTENSELELKKSELELNLVKNQLQMKLKIVQDELRAASDALGSAIKQEEFAVSYNSLISKGYQEGVNSFIETIDARTQLLNARLLVNISRIKFEIAKVNLNRETAGYTNYEEVK
ncbi:MAG: TolC family protein [Ignavibacteriaceae bacterium]|nr:TolC family protein [Ignavibacteriaceae bacterium]